MQNQLKPINSSDGQFQDGNPYTGALGTVVTSEWLNGVQSAVQSTQRELLKLLQDSKQDPDSNRDDQLLQAVRNIAWGGNAKPATLAGYGISIASQAEAEAGTDNVKAMTPLRVEQALNAAGLSGYAKNIASGSLQTVRPNGLYHVDSSLVNGTPDKSNGMLLTNFLSDKWGSQVYWMWGGATYEQRLENGNWQPWVKLLKTGQQSTLADYGITDGASKTDLQTAVNNLVAGAPGALNTLQELAAALGNDQNFAATITNQLAGKAGKATTLAGYGIADAAAKNGDASQAFNVAPATQGQHAVQMSQLFGGLRGMQQFTASSAFTVPPSVTRLYVTLVGGGGGGAGAISGAPYTPGGGGAGGVLFKAPLAVTPGQTIPLTIGAGGAGGIGSGNGGTYASSTGGAGGTTTFGNLSIAGGGGGACQPSHSNGGGPGSASLAGYGGPGSDLPSTRPDGGAGGSNIFSAPSFAGHGPQPSVLYGGGGGGGRAAGYNQNGQIGAPGLVIVEW
ncbi:glycine-rich domain-containing protein [Chromobacterium vaccinii]|uniref:glycine-rich domain-containing protein n=1 Tax=Chromobacterium piscinae TaxID=686831 RepID=UPI001C8BAB5E|nr:hypothetical protein [Chromobacterium vaccinii]MBX9356762.1 hypothetical protein [Chromobacterium vaccinii]